MFQVPGFKFQDYASNGKIEQFKSVPAQDALSGRFDPRIGRERRARSAEFFGKKIVFADTEAFKFRGGQRQA